MFSHRKTYLPMIPQTRDWYPKYIKNLHNSILRRQATQLKKMGKGLEQTVLQGRHTEGPETYEKMLIIASCQRTAFKTMMRYHLTPLRMPIINKATNNKCWRGCEDKGTLVSCW